MLLNIFTIWWTTLDYTTAETGCRSVHLLLLMVMELVLFEVAEGTNFRFLHSLCGLPLFGWHLLAVGRLVTDLTAIMTSGRPFRDGIFDFWRRRQLESWMHKLAETPVRTVTCQIVHTQDTTHVPVSTMRPMPTETSVIPGAVFDLALRIDVQERTLFVVARIKP